MREWKGSEGGRAERKSKERGIFVEGVLWS